MGKIRVTDIKVYAYHGCLEEEAIIGSDYLVQVCVDADLTKSTLSDDLSDTVDYVHINAIVAEEMGIRSKLLEQVAQRIINRIFKEITMVQAAEVSVSKVNPPIGGDVKMVTIELHQKRS
ncbi:dihydroneopterin aldolase [Spongiimicrobium salis]|uniref:dihydroneopterin aldolase n=1 Tax=Spongiimicrobium salis TaxID=1667022 RepID=UPI00374CEA78